MAKRYTQDMWAEIKKAGDPAPSLDFIEKILEGDPEEMINHDELVRRIVGYFRSITATVEDDDGNQRTIWTQAPSKGALALSIGVQWTKLNDYVRGTYSPKHTPYRTGTPNKSQIIATEDFDIIRKAFAIIESFYEQKLAAGGNVTGSIFWLLNTGTGAWTNDHTVKLEQAEPPKPEISLDDLPVLDIPEGVTIDMAELPKFEEE